MGYCVALGTEVYGFGATAYIQSAYTGGVGASAEYALNFAHEVDARGVDDCYALTRLIGLVFRAPEPDFHLVGVARNVESELERQR